MQQIFVVTDVEIFEGIRLSGQLGGWATPKDLILHLAGKLTVRVRHQLPLR